MAYEGKEFSVVSFKIYLKRIRSYYILTTYMPSTLLVFVSWISFAMPVDGGERAGIFVWFFKRFIVSSSIYIYESTILKKT
jgi:hypothetical protein